jgi:hypothetical protein
MVLRDHNAQFQKVVRHVACYRKRVVGEILLREGTNVARLNLECDGNLAGNEEGFLMAKAITLCYVELEVS